MDALFPLARAAATALSLAITPLVAQCQLEWQPGSPLSGVDGTILDMVAGTTPGTCYAVGDFGAAGDVAANNVAFWDGSSWNRLDEGTNGSISSVLLLPTGELLVAGLFSMAGGVPAANVAMWNGATWAPMGQGFDANVGSLLRMPNGDVIAGGVFQNSGATPTQNLARWNGTSWTQFATGLPNSNVRALELMPNGDVVAAGLVTIPGQFGFRPFARWDGTSWSAPNQVGFWFVNDLQAMPNGDLAIAGTFTSPSASSFAIWDGSTLQYESPPIRARDINRMANGDLVVAGYPPPGSTGAAVATRSAGVWTVELTHPQGLSAIDAAHGYVFVGGSMASQGLSVSATSALTFDGSTWQPMGGPANADVRAVVGGAGMSLFVGGEFDSIEGVAADNVAYFDGSAWHALGLGVDGVVREMALGANGDLVVAGSFLNAGGTPVANVARWNGSGWSSLAGGSSTPVRDVAVSPSGKVAIINSQGVREFDGVSWLQVPAPGFIPGALNGPRAVAYLPDGDLVFGGDLNGADVQRWDGATLTPVGTQSSLVAVNEIAVSDEGVMFRVTKDGFANRVEMFDGSVWQSLGTLNVSNLEELAVLPTGQPVVTSFTGAGVAVQVWTGSAWQLLDTPTNSIAATPAITDLSVNGAGELLMASTFALAGDRVSPFLSRAATTCPATVSTFGAGCVGSGGAMALEPLSDPWLATPVRSRATGFSTISLGVHVLGTNATLTQIPGGASLCFLMVDPLISELLVPQAGVAEIVFALPGNTALVGQSFRTQVIGLELDASLSLTSITSTNALDLTIGAY